MDDLFLSFNGQSTENVFQAQPKVRSDIILGIWNHNFYKFREKLLHLVFKFFGWSRLLGDTQRDIPAYTKTTSKTSRGESYNVLSNLWASS